MAKRPQIAGPDEDPNVTIECSSPPCFMHELDARQDTENGQDKKKARPRNRPAPRPKD
ncbi:MAG: hypothetical protein WCZ23_06215 [Rhodospirillaceae bacterium]